MPKKILLTALIVLLIPAFVLASDGTTGKVVGKVFDQGTGDALPGVNVTIEGTTLGAASDVNGNYFINNIPAGTYVLVVSYIGYEKRTVENVKILADLTTTLDFPMTETAIEGEVVVVTAERPLIQLDVTNTVRIQTEEDIENLPTRGTNSVTVLQTGVVDAPGGISVRGGRSGEVTYIVDGFSVNNYYSGNQNLQVNQAAISQLAISTGGFNAEYGRQMSGAISIVTKSGSRTYHGHVQAISDFLAGDWINTNNYGYNVYDFSLGGPVPVLKNASFFLSGERTFRADRDPDPFTDMLYDERITDPEDPLYSLNEVYKQGRKTANDLHQNSWQGKFNYRITQAMNFEAGILGRKLGWNRFSFTYYKAPEHVTHTNHWNNQTFTKLTYTFSPKTFAVFGVSHLMENNVSADRKHWDNWNEYQRTSYNRPDDIGIFRDVYDNPDTPGNEEAIGGGWNHSRISHLTFKGDLTSQINLNHQLQVGFDVQRHTLRNYSHGSMVRIESNPQHWLFEDGTPNLRIINSYGLNYEVDFEVEPDPANEEAGVFKSITNVDYSTGYSGNPPKHPLFMSLYLQDKIEYEGLVINAGLRFDYYDADSPIIADMNNPIDLETGELNLGESKVNQRMSPRIGLGFPVTERTLLHVNFGRFFQLPNLNRMIIVLDNFQERAAQAAVGRTNNPGLIPETTTAYEAGVTQQIGENLRLDFTAYYKDIADLVILKNIFAISGEYSTYLNGDYGTIKGFDCGLTLRRFRNISASVAYSLSYALGTGSTSTSAGRLVWLRKEYPKQTYPLNFDQRHKLSMMLDYRIPRDGGPDIFGKKIFSNSGINAVFSGGSGFPYTPIKEPNNQVAIKADGPVNDGPINSKSGPWQAQLDLKANKTFNVVRNIRADVYVWALNVFDRVNARSVWTTTGDYASDRWLQSAPGKDWIAQFGEEGVRQYEIAMKNRRAYRPPRQVRFGIRFLF